MALASPACAVQRRTLGTTRVPVTLLLAWIAVLAAIYFTLIYYPGVLYTDSYGRWKTAQHPFRENPCPELSFVPAVVMAFTYDLTNNYAAFSLLQSFLFFFSCFLLLHRITELPGYWPLLLTVPFLAFPLWPGYSVFHESGVGAIIGLNFVLVFIVSRRKNLGLWWSLAVHIGIFAALVVLFGFRLNAVTVFPVLAYAFCRKTPLVRASVRCAVLVGALVSANYLPRVLGSPEMDNSGVGFAWEIAQVLKRVPKPEYDHYLDYVADVRAVMEQVDETIWGINIHLLRDRDRLRRVKLNYVRLARKEPRAFFANKLSVMKRVLGVNIPLLFIEFDEDRLGQISQYGGRNTPLRHEAFQTMYAVMSKATFLNRPWIPFLVGLLVWLGDRFWPGARGRPVGVLYACAVFYYGAFLITTQSYEFRYFFPSLVLLAIVTFAVAAKTLRRWVEAMGVTFRRERERRMEESTPACVEITERPCAAPTACFKSSRSYAAGD